MKQALRERVLAKWDALTPRERDRWVAEAIFHLSVYPRRGVEEISGEVYDNYTGELIPRYTEDISHAWSVLEQDHAHTRITRRHADVWYAEKGEELVEAPTAPEAICLAALLAKTIGGAA